MSRVLRTAQADEDLHEIWLYISQDSTASADRVIDYIAARCDLLATSPLLGQPCSELFPGLRLLTAGNYVIFYQIEGIDVVIVRVLHGARDIESLLRKDA